MALTLSWCRLEGWLASFTSSVTGGLHKIGRTDNIGQRLKQLKPDVDVQVLETYRSRDLEYELHQQFMDKRLSQTQYFRLNEVEVNLARRALGLQLGQKDKLPAPHQLDSRIVEAHDQAHVLDMGALGLFDTLLLESRLACDASFLFGLRYLIIFLLLVLSVGGFTVTSDLWTHVPIVRIGKE